MLEIEDKKELFILFESILMLAHKKEDLKVIQQITQFCFQQKSLLKVFVEHVVQQQIASEKSEVNNSQAFTVKKISIVS